MRIFTRIYMRIWKKTLKRLFPETFRSLEDALIELDNAFYGTPIEDQSPRRNKDGWRHGISKPFIYKKHIYDVGSIIDESWDTYQYLKHELIHGYHKS